MDDRQVILGTITLNIPIRCPLDLLGEGFHTEIGEIKVKLGLPEQFEDSESLQAPAIASRYGIQADFMGLGNSNSRLTVGGMISNDHLHNYNIGYEMQVGHSGTRLGIRQSRMDYELGDLFSALEARGIANTTSLYGYTPIWKTVGSSLGVVYGLDYRRITDEMRKVGLSIKKHSYNAHAGLDGVWRSGKGTAVHGTLMGYFGHLSPDSEWGEVTTAAANTQGNFSKGTLDITALQRLGNATDLLWKFQGQLAGRNLDSSEQMYLGGAHGVRAYQSGAGAGDQGVLSSLELHYRTSLPGLVLRTYLDVGTVRVAKDNSLGSSTLKGWGIGLTYTHPAHYFARLDYARRIGYEANTGKDGEAKGRLWFMVGKSW
jgi:hemolysin activation/secretion protein